MSKLKHTPAPWHLQKPLTGTAKTTAHIADTEGRYVATLPFAGGLTLQNEPRKPEQYTTQKANAHLIAAAPDMYAALMDAESALAGCYEISDYPADGQSTQDAALATVRLALAKVRGEQTDSEPDAEPYPGEPDDERGNGL